MKYVLFYTSFLIICSNVLRAQELSYTESEEGILISEGENKVLFYQSKTKSLDGKYPRAHYIHPLYGIDGAELTEDFPEDHLHHRGIFWAWHQVYIGHRSIGDSWECKDFSWEVDDIQIFPTDSLLILAVGINWKSPNWLAENGTEVPFLREMTKITVHPQIDNYRIIDFETTLLAKVKELKIGGSEDEKGYGGFSVRMKLPEDLRFVSDDRNITPAVGPVKAGKWMNISGSLAKNGTKAGLVLMSYPKTGETEHWILRAKTSMQNIPYPGREPVLISDREHTRLEYRLIIYEGELSKNTIGRNYKK